MDQTTVRIVRFIHGQLWTEGFGNPIHPLVLLIAGAEKQGIYWSSSWCQRLAAAGYFVVRFDHRDTGLSTQVNFNMFPYRLMDLVTDVQGILRAYGCVKAHLIGSGMGGYVAQLMALHFPEQVQSLTLMMTTDDAKSIEDRHRVSMNKATNGSIGAIPHVFLNRIHPKDPKWVFKTVQHLKALNGMEAPFDEDAAEQYAVHLKNRMCWTQETEMGKRPLMNHLDFLPHHLLAKTLSPLVFESYHITQPTLIIHGTTDPVIPMHHAETLHTRIPHSHLLRIKGMGHLLTTTFEEVVYEAVVSHVRHHII